MNFWAESAGNDRCFQSWLYSSEYEDVIFAVGQILGDEEKVLDENRIDGGNEKINHLRVILTDDLKAPGLTLVAFGMVMLFRNLQSSKANFPISCS